MVDLPAPFSPSKAWISPGSVVRSMRSLATNDPNTLVIPRRSSNTAPGSPHELEGFTAVGVGPAVWPIRLVGRALRLDAHTAIDDRPLERIALAVDLVRPFVVEVVVRSEPDALVLARADIGFGRELVVHALLDGVLDRVRDLLDHRGEDDVAVLGRLVAVGVDPDELDVLGFLRRRRRT